MDVVSFEGLRQSQPNGVMSRAVSIPHHTFTGQVSQWLTSIAHILSPETDNCSSQVRIRKVSDRRKYFLINLHKRMLGKTSGGGTLNLLITDVHPTDLPRPAIRVDASMDISTWT